jgi:RNA polymerase subunit RPABC4/transcription elongation factor Spt4
MSEMKFSDNYRDLCEQGGVDSGFQFEFYCQRCSDAWRSAFVPYRAGQASGWLGKAAGFLGGVVGEIGAAADGMAQAGWSNSRDEAFRNAVQEAEAHFHRCAKCFQHVCGTCWNAAKGLCLNCAPDAAVEIEAARSEGEMQAASEKAMEYGKTMGGQHDVKESRQLVCPGCGTEAHGAHFCPNCGMKLAVNSACPGCSATVPPDAKFCPECGHKMHG